MGARDARTWSPAVGCSRGVMPIEKKQGSHAFKKKDEGALP